MARRFLRSGGDLQVAPDAMISRRTEFPCSWDEPVSEAYQTYPLLGDPGAFDQVELQLQLTKEQDDKASAPRVHYGGHRFFTVTSSGRGTPKHGSLGSSLWTITSKMTCPSFSLPAGPTSEQGSCVAANAGKTGGMREDGETYICDGCYSLEGQYVYPNVAAAQAARQAWVLQLLRKDPSGELLGQEITAAIEDYARNATLKSLPDATAIRMTQELGVWDGRAIEAPVYIKPLDRIEKVSVFPTPLPQISGFSDSRQWLASLNPRVGEVVGFFRIHDSGDFTPGSDARLWPGYVNAWGIAARAFPKVRFWGPTRIWMFPKLLEQLRALCAELDNFIIRPSALHVGEPAPLIEGLATGTTVTRTKGKKDNLTYVPTFDASGRPSYNCPVYLTGEFKSCMAAGCRACWITNAPVAYGWH